MVRVRKLSVGAAVVAVVLAGALSGCSGSPAEEPEELTVTQAGARYLDAVCPVNDTWDAVDAEVERIRVAVSRGDSADTQQLAAALARLERGTLAAVDMLEDAAVAWPTAAEQAITDVRETLAADAEQAAAVAELSDTEVASYSWEGAGDIAAAASTARAALGLPEDPAEACEAREQATPSG